MEKSSKIPDTYKASVVVVDDDDAIRRAMIQILKNEGYEVFAATDGKGALELTSRRTFDLMLLDIMMPGYSGLEVMTVMQAARPDMPIVVVSALSDQATKKQAMTLGARGYLTKPFGPKDLVEILDTIFSSSYEQEKETQLPYQDEPASPE